MALGVVVEQKLNLYALKLILSLSLHPSPCFYLRLPNDNTVEQW